MNKRIACNGLPSQRGKGSASLKRLLELLLGRVRCELLSEHNMGHDARECDLLPQNQKPFEWSNGFLLNLVPNIVC